MSEDTVLIRCRICGDDHPEDEYGAIFPASEEIGPCCEDDMVTLDNGEIVHCDDAGYCSYSDQFHPIDEICSCDECGEYVHQSYITAGIRRGSHIDVCQHCLENGEYCYPEDDCYTLYHCDDLYYNERDGGMYTYPQGCDGIYPYDTNILDVLDYKAYVQNQELRGLGLRGFGKHLVLGVELECDRRDGYEPADIFDKLEAAGFDSYAIAKEDGTCSGLELVTLPADLDSHKSTYNWSDWLAGMRETAKGYYADDSGMHVHINRAAVSPLTLGKMLVFCNSLDNVPFLSLIAQRQVDSVGWCRLNPSKFDKVGKAANDPHNGKYSILNVTPHTVEVRMFRSNLTTERVFKNLEFCDALVHYCRRSSARDITAKGMQAYVAMNRERYPHLHEYINTVTNSHTSIDE